MIDKEPPSLKALSMSSWSIHDPTDLSALYFGGGGNGGNGGNAGHDTTTSHRKNEDNEDNDNPAGVIYAGPIEVRQKQDGSGRGLFVTRNVKAGELLFIAQPHVTASVPDVYNRRCEGQGHREEVLDDDKRGGEHFAAAATAATTTPITVSEASEQCLVDAIMEGQRQNDASLCAALQFLQHPQQQTPTGTSCTDDAAAAASAASDVIVHTDDVPLMTLLLGGGGGKQQHLSSSSPPSPQKEPADDPLPHFWTVEQVTQLVRRNAFGPDFTTPLSIQALWQESQQHEQQRPERPDDDDNENENHTSSSSSSPTPPFLPPRLLGLYAIPAMINHSCWPNAVRVYVGDATMIVHASRDIDNDDGEILWSYVPVVQPHRRRQLQQTHGFCCHCDRCVAEEGTMLPFMNGDDGNNGDDIIDDDNAISSSLSSKKLTVAELEESILPSLSSNELRRYIRVSYLSVYLNEVNSSPPDPKRWIPLGMQLHLALAACHNASTEHLSVR
jgi:hypothetical protein